MSAAVNLQVPPDYGLVVAGVLGTVLILIKNRKANRPVRSGRVGAAAGGNIHPLSGL